LKPSKRPKVDEDGTRAIHRRLLRSLRRYERAEEGRRVRKDGGKERTMERRSRPDDVRAVPLRRVRDHRTGADQPGYRTMNDPELPPDHPMSAVLTVPKDEHENNVIAILVFKRIGDWAITQICHAGRVHPPVEPWLGSPEVTWLREGENYGRGIGTFIAFSDQETALLELLQAFDDQTAKQHLAGLWKEYVDDDAIRRKLTEVGR
jgi:hypothetical protein